jgi:hypothetical protein
MLRIESNFLATLDKNQRETYYRLCEKQKLVYGLENN